MKLELKAKQYTEALFNVAVESKSEKEVKDSIILFNDISKKSSEFRAFLLSKRISDSDKAKVVKEAFGKQCHPIVSEFVALINGENPIKLFQLIQKYYDTKFADSMNLVEVSADIPKSISESDEKELKASIESILDKTAELSINVDPSLLGGIKLRVGNKFMDESVQNRLEKMRQSLLKT